MGTAYYNEIEPFAAAWLRELIAAGEIAPGVVDERSIEDVRPDELAGFTQCHFFAGIGVWSHAFRRAGWPDDRPLWTGSCPCQPFSAAGKGEGFADERHLWPAFYHLIEQCEPPVVAGEQVAGGGVGVWFDLVQADLEAMGYAFGLVPLPAAGFGGAHIRDRAFWLADAESMRQPGRSIRTEARMPQDGIEKVRDLGGLAYSNGRQCDRITEFRGAVGHGSDAGWSQGVGGAAASRINGGVANAQRGGREGGAVASSGEATVIASQVGGMGRMGHNSGTSAPMLGRNAADWLFCRDGKWRPVGPGTFPLAHEAPARVGRLRGYGNAIDAETLFQFAQAVIGHLDGHPVMEAA